jgi:hypothetical protein
VTHRNTVAAIISTGLGAAVVKLAAHYQPALSDVDSAVIAGGIISAVLFVGRRGLKGTAAAVWGGFGVAWGGTKQAKK